MPVPGRGFTYWAFVGAIIINLFNSAQAQTGAGKPGMQTETELGGLISSSSATPFWLRTNQFGIIPLSSPAATLRVRFSREYIAPDTTGKTPKRTDWGVVFNPVVNAGRTSQFILAEAYLKGRLGVFELFAGRRREVIGLGDSTLSLGFIIGSGNALPIPKVQIGTRGYVPLKFLGSLLAISAGYGHAWYNVDYIKGAFLHQKYLYGRFGKPNWPVKLHLGVNHQVMWGGQADFLRTFPDLSNNGKLPSSLKAYISVVTGRIPKDWQTTDITAFDNYAVGNNLGGYDAGLEVNGRQMTFMLYHQHIFEDKSGIMMVNFPDGLTGLSWHRTHPEQHRAAFQVNRLVLEYISTLDQSGATFYVPNSIYQGRDNYFNHSQYQEGWSYKGRTIGSPFIAPNKDFRPEKQQQGGYYFPNTRIEVWYAGAEGKLFNRIGWRLRTSYSNNFGTFQSPYQPVIGQLSTLLSAQFSFPHWANTLLTTSVALDQGNLYPNTVGGFLSLKKVW